MPDSNTSNYANLSLTANQIISAGPVFAAVILPGSPVVNGQSVVAANTASLRVHATLAKTATVAKMQVRWQVEGAQGLWVAADPHDVTVIGGNQLEFTVYYDFTQQVTLRFSCAEPGGSDWGAPFALSISVVADLLVLENPLIRLDAARIILSCAIREPSAQVKFARLELSVDGGAHWQDISDKKAGSSSPLVFRDDITGTTRKERDFSQGVYLRVTDNLQRVTPYQIARFDAATFLSAAWDGASAMLADINSGEALTYSVHLHCASGVVLPPATLSLQLPEAAVEADTSARCWYWMLDDASGEPQGNAFDAFGWRGSAGASEIYRGPIQSGLINAAAHVRSDESLLHKALPPATLTIDSRDFFVKPFTSSEPVRAQVYRPAPHFQIVNPQLYTHKNNVILRGDFTPPLEPAPVLIFTVTVNNGIAHPVTPVLVTSNGFELHLDHRVFSAFSQNGTYSVRLTVRRSADVRADERSSHSETLTFTLNNDAAIFKHVYVMVESGGLRLEGEVSEPAADNPVTELLMFWDGSGEKMEPIPLKLEAQGGGRSSFFHAIAISQFEGSLYPIIKAVTKAGVPVSQNLLFSTAWGLLEMVLKISGSSGSSAIAHHDTHNVNAGTLAFELSVKSLVGLHQTIDMYLRLGDAFSASSVTTIHPPASGKGKVTLLDSWDGLSQTNLLVTEVLEKGASFSISGTTTLKKLAVQDLKTAETISIAFSEPDAPPRTIFASSEAEGLVFTARLMAQ